MGGSISPYVLTKATDTFVRAVASIDGPIMLQGETGTGKSFLAELIHHLSRRREKRLLAVGCGGLPRELLDRELFGHVRGAFTGADRTAQGLVDATCGGTLVLNEIEAIDASSQPKILDLADGGLVRAIGSTEIRERDVRIIATTNADLTAAIKDGRFRYDLYQRLAMFYHELPPLRKRRNDIPVLTEILLQSLGAKELKQRECSGFVIEAEALEALTTHSWPGNLRELKAVLARAAVAAPDGRISAQHVRASIEIGVALLPRSSGEDQSARRTNRYVASGPEAERREIRMALSAANGNKTHAARKLGMSRTTLWGRMKWYGIEA